MQVNKRIKYTHAYTQKFTNSECQLALAINFVQWHLILVNLLRKEFA